MEWKTQQVHYISSDVDNSVLSREYDETKKQSCSSSRHRRWQRSISVPVSVSLFNNDDDASVESDAAAVGMPDQYQNQNHHDIRGSGSTCNYVSEPLMNDVADRESNMALDEHDNDKVSIFSSTRCTITTIMIHKRRRHREE